MDIKRCLKILGLQSVSSPKQVKKAYRYLVRTWHPDRIAPHSRLKDKAEKKIRNINLAYEQLTAFLSSKDAKNKLKWLGQSSDVNLKSAERNKDTNQHANPQYPKTATYRVFSNSRQRIFKKPTASGLPDAPPKGKYVLFGFLIIFTVVFAFIIHYLLTFDGSNFDNTDSISSILNKLAIDSQQSKSIGQVNSRRRTMTKANSFEKSKLHSILPNEQNTYCAIHLKDGSIMITEVCWKQDNMILFKTANGIFGIETNTVDKIIKKKIK